MGEIWRSHLLGKLTSRLLQSLCYQLPRLIDVSFQLKITHNGDACRRRAWLSPGVPIALSIGRVTSDSTSSGQARVILFEFRLGGKARKDIQGHLDDGAKYQR